MTSLTVTQPAALSMGFSRQEYWSGFPFPPPGDLPDQGMEPTFPALQEDSLPLSHLGSPTTLVKVKVKSLSRAQLLATPWTGAYQALPSMGFSRQEYWSGVPLPGSSIHGIFQPRVLEWVAISFSRDPPNPGIEPGLLHCMQTSHQGSPYYFRDHIKLIYWNL